MQTGGNCFKHIEKVEDEDGETIQLFKHGCTGDQARNHFQVGSSELSKIQGYVKNLPVHKSDGSLPTFY